MDILEPWPGKSAAFIGTIDHPALYHMLDVAAVAERLLAASGLSPEVRQGLVALIALHDLGKISFQFRAMLRDGRPR